MRAYGRIFHDVTLPRQRKNWSIMSFIIKQVNSKPDHKFNLLRHSICASVQLFSEQQMKLSQIFTATLNQVAAISKSFTCHPNLLSDSQVIPHSGQSGIIWVICPRC